MNKNSFLESNSELLFDILRDKWIILLRLRDALYLKFDFIIDFIGGLVEIFPILCT